MKLFLISAVLVLAVLCYVFYVWCTLSQAKKLTMSAVIYPTPYEQRPTNSSMRILVAGDSTAVGVGADSKDSIAGRIGKDFPSADITNVGVSGLRLAGLKQKLASRGEATYDLVVLQIGANDITGRTSYADIQKTLGEVLHMADGVGKKVIVLTAGNVGAAPAFKWPLSWYMTARTRIVRQIFMTEVAKHPNATYIDLFEEAAEDTFSKDIKRYYAPDFFHPSGDGYGVWYTKLRLQLKF